MLRMLARFTAVACALWASQALALGLGDINVKSRLNQPFSASIAVLGATSAQLDSLSVKLASAEEFNRAGIERSDYLSSLKFEVQDVPGGARVLVSSSQLAREPFLNFILEVRSPDGKLLREYTVLLDPPVAADSSAPAAAPSSSPAPSPAYAPPAAPVVQVPAPAAPSMAPAEAAQLAALAPGAKATAARHKGRPARPPASPATPATPAAAAVAPAPAPEAVAVTPAPAGGSSYGPTAPQETLWSIATKLRPGPQVSMDQVLLALYRANPQSFDRGSFNGLLKGQTLKVPSLADMQESSPEQAKQAVDAWRHGHHPGGAQKAEAKAAVAPQPKPVAPKPAPPKPAKPIKLPAEAKPELPAPAPLPAPAAPAPAPEHKPAASAPPPPATLPAKPVAEAATPAPAAPAPTAPASPASTVPATPALAANGPAADTAANATAAPPAAPEPPKKKLVTQPTPPPQTSLLDDQLPMIGGGIFAVVVGLFAWLIFRRRKAPPMPDFRAKAPAAKTPAIKAPPPVPPPVKGGPPPLPVKEAELGDTTALPDEPPAPAKPEPAADLGKAAPAVEPPLAKTSLDDTAQLKAAEASLAEPAFSRTGQMKAAAAGGGDVDFDLTSQFEAQTLSVNLDANDPLSEADFHLAYGLYDEAASLLKQALAKEPQRQDLRQKLAETYFAGTKPMEFQETAEALHGQISPAEWQKIAIMGRQLCPDAALFKSDGSAAPAPDIDLSLGDSIGPAAVQVLGAAPDHATPGNVIDFDLDAELNKATPTAAAPVAAAPAAPAPPPPAAAEKTDFDLSHFDFGAEPHPAGQEGSVEFNLDELDLSKPAAGGVSSGDEIGTKLDLARVYADMGDNDAARGLLNEVMNTGNAGQKAEAEALIKRLSA